MRTTNKPFPLLALLALYVYIIINAQRCVKGSALTSFLSKVIITPPPPLQHHVDPLAPPAHVLGQDKKLAPLPRLLSSLDAAYILFYYSHAQRHAINDLDTNHAQLRSPASTSAKLPSPPCARTSTSSSPPASRPPPSSSPQPDLMIISNRSPEIMLGTKKGKRTRWRQRSSYSARRQQDRPSSQRRSAARHHYDDVGRSVEEWAPCFCACSCCFIVS